MAETRLFFRVCSPSLMLVMMQMVRRNNYNRDKLATEFGIQVQEKLALVEARVLPPPEVIYDLSNLLYLLCFIFIFSLCSM